MNSLVELTRQRRSLFPFLLRRFRRKVDLPYKWGCHYGNCSGFVRHWTLVYYFAIISVKLTIRGTRRVFYDVVSCFFPLRCSKNNELNQDCTGVSSAAICVQTNWGKLRMWRADQISISGFDTRMQIDLSFVQTAHGTRILLTTSDIWWYCVCGFTVRRVACSASVFLFFCTDSLAYLYWHTTTVLTSHCIT